MQATRDCDGRYALIYLPAGDAVELDLAKLAGDELAGYWFDPRTGAARAIGVVHKHERMSFTPPQCGLDWVLVLDDVAGGFPPPGSVRS